MMEQGQGMEGHSWVPLRALTYSHNQILESPKLSIVLGGACRWQFWVCGL